MTQPIRKTIEVPCGPGTAFDIFTLHTSDWWPLDAHTVSAMAGHPAKSVTIEPKAGGRVFEVKADGTEESWGTVVAFDRPHRLVIAWAIMVPGDQATEVEVTFAPIARGGTRVDLVHRGWEALARDAEAERDSYAKGWVRVFEERYAAACS
jgi:uncharacterized protein YndB with AHSA1/START domain